VFYFNKEPRGGALRVHKPAIAVHIPHELTPSAGSQDLDKKEEAVVETDAFIDISPRFGRVAIFRR
jgi:hypothetical protein